MSLKQRKIQDCERYLDEWNKKKTTLKELEGDVLSNLTNMVKKIITNKNRNINKIKLEHSSLSDNVEKLKTSVRHKEARIVYADYICERIFPWIVIIIFSALQFVYISWGIAFWTYLSAVIGIACIGRACKACRPKILAESRREILSMTNELVTAVKHLREFNLNSKIKLINLQSFDKVIGLSSALISEPMSTLFKELEKEYHSITSKYYIEDFSKTKIDNDIKESIEGKFPNTFKVSANFYKEFSDLLSQISDKKLLMDKKEEVKKIFALD